jgi:hypothetical protein
MTRDPEVLLLRCRRGSVHGVVNAVAPYTGFRFVCCCQDCRVFAQFLERPDALDIAVGTDIFHVPTGRVKLTAGTDAVRCLHFSSKVLRWYTDCCRTPVGNTAGSRFPLVGLIHSFMSLDADGHSRDERSARPRGARPSGRSYRTLLRRLRRAAEHVGPGNREYTFRGDEPSPEIRTREREGLCPSSRHPWRQSGSLEKNIMSITARLGMV